jgi:acyl-CoA thioester hydrolase
MGDGHLICGDEILTRHAIGFNMEDTPIIEIDIEVRFKDVDAMGHVNNAVYFTYFEEGRKHLFFRHLQSKEQERFNFILAHISCDYMWPIQMADRPHLTVFVNKIGTKSFGLVYRLMEMQAKDRVYAVGESIQVSYDYGQGRSVPLPDDIRKVLSAYELSPAG